MDAGYERVPVRPYIPNPLRCFKCQLYGHHGNACRSIQFFCGKCACEGHSSEQCLSLVEKCRKCSEAHSTFSRDCSAWKLEKEVCTVKAVEGISYFDARKRVKEAHTAPSPGVSYAASVQMHPVMKSVSIQTEPLPAAPAPAVSLTMNTSSAPPTPTTRKIITCLFLLPFLFLHLHLYLLLLHLNQICLCCHYHFIKERKERQG